MPMLQFLCPCGNTFEKLMLCHKALYKWCPHCDRLTIWTSVLDPNNKYFKQKVCSECQGNEYIPPMAVPNPKYEEDIKTECPKCGAMATHVLCVETRGSSATGPNHTNSSIAFRFNYLAPDS